MDPPILPPELERIIFLYAYKNKLCNGHDVALVAKRVHEWLSPLLFDVVISHFNRDFPVRTNDLSTYQTYGNYIHHLLLASVGDLDFDQVVNAYVSLCPNLTNLAIWKRNCRIRLDVLTNLNHLTHLSIDVPYLIYSIHPTVSESDPSVSSHDTHGEMEQSRETEQVPQAPPPPMFPNLTHLDAMGTPFDTANANFFSSQLATHFPSLTHIGFLHWTAETPSVLNPILSSLQSLKVLVWWRPGPVLSESTISPPVDDVRIVSLSTNRLKDWEDWARENGVGVWAVADEIVERRRSEQAG
ncbi:hypothetical protein BDN72DRAFT_962289 [Pluteus cervinus]|uniref:Uncharacterized protein n=1 Tax=Pluteus cervinus TaxID=181527 RepID=A0ACD3AJ83_9AGAR|nr:hypothetical protein BDN72DRAFT_962289 [Pluteus cervinus]